MTAIIAKFSSVPVEAWFGLLGVVVGAAFSIFGNWLNNKSSLKLLNTRLDREEGWKNRDKVEDRRERVLLVLSKWNKHCFSHHMTFAGVLAGKLTFEQGTDLTMGFAEKRDFDADELNAKLALYFPEYTKDYKLIQEILDELAQLILDARELGYPDKEIHNKFSKKLIHLSVAQENFEKRLSQNRDT